MILVTGATGLLGAHLLADLVKLGHSVRALIRSNSNRVVVKKVFDLYAPEYSPIETIEWLEGDILDIFSLHKAMEGVEFVYHCAAMVSFNSKDRDLMMQINSTGTANVMNVALEKGVQKVCHVSSVAALGKPAQKADISEENWWKNSPEKSWYAKSKYAAEREAWRAAEEGLNVVIINPSVILGAGDWSKGSAEIISTASKGMKFYATGATGFVDVRDVSMSMIKLMKTSYNRERYIISSENITFRDLFNLIHDCLGRKKPSIKAGPFLTGLTWRAELIRCIVTGSKPFITKETAYASSKSYSFSNAKIKKEANIEFIPIEQTVKEICEVFLKEKIKSS